MSFYKSFYGVSMSIGLGEISITNIFLMLRFGLVGEMKTANQTNPCS